MKNYGGNLTCNEKIIKTLETLPKYTKVLIK